MLRSHSTQYGEQPGPSLAERALLNGTVSVFAPIVSMAKMLNVAYRGVCGVGG